MKRFLLILICVVLSLCIFSISVFGVQNIYDSVYWTSVISNSVIKSGSNTVASVTGTSSPQNFLGGTSSFVYRYINNQVNLSYISPTTGGRLSYILPMALLDQNDGISFTFYLCCSSAYGVSSILSSAKVTLSGTDPDGLSFDISSTDYTVGGMFSTDVQLTGGYTTYFRKVTVSSLDFYDLTSLTVNLIFPGVTGLPVNSRMGFCAELVESTPPDVTDDKVLAGIQEIAGKLDDLYNPSPDQEQDVSDLNQSMAGVSDKINDYEDIMNSVNQPDPGGLISDFGSLTDGFYDMSAGTLMHSIFDHSYITFMFTFVGGLCVISYVMFGKKAA